MRLFLSVEAQVVPKQGILDFNGVNFRQMSKLQQEMSGFRVSTCASLQDVNINCQKSSVEKYVALHYCHV